MPDSVFAANENGTVYGLDAQSGTLLNGGAANPNLLWRTSELPSGGRGSLGYARVATFDINGAPSPFPVITVPTEGGRVATLFARIGDETMFGNRLAYGFRIDAPITASITNAATPNPLVDGFLYASGENGITYALSGTNSGGGGGFGGFPFPITEDITDNDNNPDVQEFRNAEIAITTRTGYLNLRRTEVGSNQGTVPKTDVFTAGGAYNPASWPAQGDLPHGAQAPPLVRVGRDGLPPRLQTSRRARRTRTGIRSPRPWSR